MEEEKVFISEEGMKEILNLYDPKDPHKNVYWTTNYRLEMPIRVKREGAGSETPITIIDMFKEQCQLHSKKLALTVKRNNKWQSRTFEEYYKDVQIFAQALLAYGINEMSAVNIIGFNSPEWLITFMGSIHAHNLPVGIYTTNNPEACHYVSEHSECELVVADTREQLKKYLKIWDKLPRLKGIVIYNDDIPIQEIPEQYRKLVFKWKDFMDIGRKSGLQSQVQERIAKLRPGHCCTLIYTSGTTGNPKGVMLSHDNYTFLITQLKKKYTVPGDIFKLVSYLPLSHVVGQLIDIIGSLKWGAGLYFANPDALQGSLINTLKEVRPSLFFSVPRVWEKIYDQMQLMAKSNGAIKTKIGTWAKSIGKQGTFAQTHGTKLPLCFGLAEKLVYHNIKKALGLDEARFLIFGAAPLSPVIREYFLTLNMYLINGYGMSECTGAQSLADPHYFQQFEGIDFLSSAGQPTYGTELKIDNPDKDGNGEICFRGRHVFMGYFKDEESTRNSIDKDRWLHSGDIGRVDKNGNLVITGRIKELIITAGGENVAPILIEDEIKKTIPFVSNCMVIGEKRKYLSLLITLKHKLKPDGQPTEELHEDVIAQFKAWGSQATTISQAQNDQVISQNIQELINSANTKVISKAQYIRKWALLPGDFSLDTGELTPTLKLKRRVVEQKWQNEIEKMYLDAKL